MFKVELVLSFQIEGCPKCGIKAIDFRTANSLSPHPSNTYWFFLEEVNESLCREYSEWLNDDADLVVKVGDGIELPEFLGVLRDPIFPLVEHPVVPVETIREFESGDRQSISKMLFAYKSLAEIKLSSESQ